MFDVDCRRVIVTSPRFRLISCSDDKAHRLTRPQRRPGFKELTKPPGLARAPAIELGEENEKFQLLHSPLVRFNV